MASSESKTMILSVWYPCSFIQVINLFLHERPSSTQQIFSVHPIS